MKTRSLAAILLALSISGLIGNCGNSNDTATAEDTQYQALPASSDMTVTWHEDWNAAMAAAKEAKKPILVHFTADWCVYCKKMKNETYAAPQIKKRFHDGWVTVLIDTENMKAQGSVYLDANAKKAMAYLKDGEEGAYDEKSLTNVEMMQFFGGTGLPTLLFIDKDGVPLQKIAGFVEKESFAVILDYFQEEAYKKNTNFDDYRKNHKGI